MEVAITIALIVQVIALLYSVVAISKRDTDYLAYATILTGIVFLMLLGLLIHYTTTIMPKIAALA